MDDVKPTEEQQAIIDAGCSGESFTVDAVAGSGKTTVLNMTSRAMGTGILYLVYNTEAAKDAKKKFPTNVDVKTTSALAYGDYRELYQERIFGPRIPARETARILGLSHPLELGENLLIPPDFLARYAMETVERFCHVADVNVSEKHVPELPVGMNIAQEALLRQEIARWAKKLWKDSIVPTSAHRFTFDHAFKLYAMSNPLVSYDTIMLDEAQDSNEIVEHFIKGQYGQKIVVGDPAQALYEWRGAINIMDRFEGERLPLSQSWRFGNRIAEEADKWLAHSGTGITVKGNPAMDSFVVDGGMTSPDAVLCRSNGSVMANAMNFMDHGLKVAVAGGTDALKSLAFAAGNLKQGKRSNHPELIAFRSWGELMSYTDEPGGGDLKAMVGLINRFGVGAIIDACNATVTERGGNPDIVVSTAHKAKGREWDNVQVSDDFPEPKPTINPLTGDAEPGHVLKSEARLHYVTVTRARRTLDRGSLAFADTHKPTTHKTMTIH